METNYLHLTIVLLYRPSSYFIARRPTLPPIVLLYRSSSRFPLRRRPAACPRDPVNAAVKFQSGAAAK
ncbi:MAG: hypothetical protein GY821_13155 [Gammaproteobacteria bacterium]|nr:hypothetical protein [Gammaproteobacteria bacterium]